MPSHPINPNSKKMTDTVYKWIDKNGMLEHRMDRP